MFRVLYAGEHARLPLRFETKVRETGGILEDTAGSPGEALEMIATHPYDMVVLDPRISETDYTTLLWTIRTTAPGTTILLGSGMGTLPTVEPVSSTRDAPFTDPASRVCPFRENSSGITPMDTVYRKEAKADYGSVLEKTREIILIVLDGIIVFSNRSFRTMFGHGTPKTIDGHLLSEFIPALETGNWIRQLLKRTSQKDPHQDFSFRILGLDGSIRYFSGRAGLTDWKGQRALLLCITDVTFGTEAEIALMHANRKITLLNDLTRHDITNRLTVLRARIKRARLASRDPQVFIELEEAERAGNDIHRYLETARMYQDRGMVYPRWLSLHAILESSRRAMQLKNINMSFISVHVEIFADPLCPRVFENMFDNSVRHGNTVSTIRVSTQETDAGLVILLEDNGCGIADNEKEAVFNQGFGTNSGLGLFLTREILAITGITIRETGIFGSGARFEIAVPRGAYRQGPCARAEALSNV